MRSLKRITGAFEGGGRERETRRNDMQSGRIALLRGRREKCRGEPLFLLSPLFFSFFFLFPPLFFLFLVDERHETEKKTRLIRLREEIINEARMWATVKNTRQCRNGISVKNKPTGIDFSNRRRCVSRRSLVCQWSIIQL